MSHTTTGATCVDLNGRDTTSIDYFLARSTTVVQDTTPIDDLPSNTSDHYPVITNVCAEIGRSNPQKKSKTLRKTLWKKVDMDLYKALVFTN